MNRNTTQDEFRWQAVVARDRSQGQNFIFAVRSTGIFCRPGCKSRTPRREQVVFFDTADQASQAGFRPCKRCQPTLSGSADAQKELVVQACALLDKDDRPVSLEALGKALSVSPSHLQRVFKLIMGVSPRQYASARRVERFKKAARESVSLTDAIFEAGYGSTSRLYEKSGQRLGMSPGRYAAGGLSMKIYYTIVDCALGRMLLAGTARGIAGLAFADEVSDLESFLRSEFPAAQLERDDDRLSAWVAIIQAYLNGEANSFMTLLELPLDVRSTAFQARVWEALRRIPVGETRTYTQVAESLGKPDAVRAVARACATNPVSLVTPCHRVVRRDGSLAGYRWGLARKRALLDLEQNPG